MARVYAICLVSIIILIPAFKSAQEGRIVYYQTEHGEEWYYLPPVQNITEESMKIQTPSNKTPEPYKSKHEAFQNAFKQSMSDVSTSNPTQQPTSHPTNSPTHNPTINPTMKPTSSPTQEPTVDPTPNPTSKPTKSPSKDGKYAIVKQKSHSKKRIDLSKSDYTNVYLKLTEIDDESECQSILQEHPVSESIQREPIQSDLQEFQPRKPKKKAKRLTQTPTKQPTKSPTQQPTESPTEQPTHSLTTLTTEPPANNSSKDDSVKPMKQANKVIVFWTLPLDDNEYTETQLQNYAAESMDPSTLIILTRFVGPLPKMKLIVQVCTKYSRIIDGICQFFEDITAKIWFPKHCIFETFQAVLIRMRYLDSMDLENIMYAIEEMHPANYATLEKKLMIRHLKDPKTWSNCMDSDKLMNDESVFELMTDFVGLSICHALIFMAREYSNCDASMNITLLMKEIQDLTHVFVHGIKENKQLNHNNVKELTTRMRALYFVYIDYKIVSKVIELSANKHFRSMSIFVLRSSKDFVFKAEMNAIARSANYKIMAREFRSNLGRLNKKLEEGVYHLLGGMLFFMLIRYVYHWLNCDD